MDPPREVARAAVDGLEKGMRAVIPGAHNTIAAMGGRIAPRSLLLPAIGRFFKAGP